MIFLFYNFFILNKNRICIKHTISFCDKVITCKKLEKQACGEIALFWNSY